MTLRFELGELLPSFNEIIQNETVNQKKRNYPSEITVKIGKISQIIYSDVLIKKSKKFKAMLSHNMREKNKKTISIIVPPGFSESSINNFLCHLSHVSKPKITDENAIELLRLSDEHLVEDLLKSCLKFISDNLDLYLLREIIYEEAYNIPELKWICLIYIIKNRLNIPIDFINIIHDKSLSSDMKEFVKLAIRCSASDFGYDTQVSGFIASMSGLNIVKVEKISDSTLAFLYELNTLIGLQGIEINSPDVTQDDLLSLAQILPHLKYLKIENANISYIPNEWQYSLKCLICDGCNFLTSLYLPNAEDISCKNCTSITEIYAPNVKKIDCTGCFFLISLTVQKAKTVICTGCASLKSLYAKQAHDVICAGCISLSVLYVPNFLGILNCNKCFSLKSLVTNGYGTILCDNNPHLLNIEAPNVKGIFCDDCTALESIKVDKAEKVYCNRCISLINIYAPNAKRLYCNDSANLKIIKAANINTISCRNCIALIKIDFPIAEYILCDGCISLNIIFAPNALQISYNDCISLTRVRVPLNANISSNNTRLIENSCSLI